MSGSDVIFVLVRGGRLPYIDGGEYSTISTVTALEEHGVRCKFLLTGEDDLARELDRHGIPYAVLDTADPADGVRSIPWRARLERLQRLVRSNAAVFRRTREEGASIVHVSGIPALLSSFFGAKLGRAKVVMHVRDMSRVSRTRWYEVVAMMLADRTVAISTSLRQALIDTAASPLRGLLAGRIEAVFNGFDFAAIDAFIAGHGRDECRAAARLAPDELLVVMVGSICERKGQLRFLERVVPAAARAIPRLRVALIGGIKGEEYGDACRRAIASAGLDSRVQLLGNLPLNDVYRWYRAADLAAVASEREGLSRFAVEAQAFALPVVSTRIVGPIDVVREGESGYLVPGDRIEEMADRLIELANDPALRRRMGEAGARQARARFSLASHRDGILGVYRQIGGLPGRQPGTVREA
jgi:glycosyltransferase involved in cell wall biosynthesis